MNYEIEQFDWNAGATMINESLRRYSATAPLTLGAHLDDDALNAFIEGAVDECEAEPLLAHLIACAACRRNTVQLLRLSDELGASELTGENNHNHYPAEPSRIKQLLESLRAKIFPVTDTDSVLAYQAREEEEIKKVEENVTEGKPDKQ